MGTKKVNGAKKGTSAGTSAAFDSGVEKLESLAQQMLATMNEMGLQSLSAEERAHSIGKMRAGEPAATEHILDAMERFPSVFQSLASSDGGTDPDKLETAPARDALARVSALSPVVSLLHELTTMASDDVLASGATAKTLTLAAYAIGKANAPSNTKLRMALAPAVTFYAAASRLHSGRSLKATNKAKKAAKAPKTAPPGGSNA